MTAVLSGKPTFGAGRVFATANLANPTPARANTPQSQSVDFKRKTESLFGEKQLPVAVGAGEMDVTAKVEYGKAVSRILSDIMLGDSQATGSYLEADGEAGTVPATTTYVVTVANAADYLFDLGVVNADTGVILTAVEAGDESEGASYSVVTSGANKGKYTFAAGDANAKVKISYGYTNSTAGATISMTNQLQGLTGAFTAVHVLPWGTEQDMFVFNNCIASGQSLSAKKSGFASTSLDYAAFTDGSDILGTATFAEAA